MAGAGIEREGVCERRSAQGEVLRHDRVQGPIAVQDERRRMHGVNACKGNGYEFPSLAGVERDGRT